MWKLYIGLALSSKTPNPGGAPAFQYVAQSGREQVTRQPLKKQDCWLRIYAQFFRSRITPDPRNSMPGQPGRQYHEVGVFPSNAAARDMVALIPDAWVRVHQPLALVVPV